MDNLDIWRSAKVLVDRYGENAEIEAGLRADEMLDKGDVDGASVWRRIVKAAEELLNTTPSGPAH